MKSQKQNGRPVKKSLNRRRKESFSKYIHKMLRQMNRELSMSPKALTILNTFVNDMFERIGAEASRLTRYHNKPTVTAKEIQAAVKTLLPTDITKHMGLSDPEPVTDQEDSS